MLKKLWLAIGLTIATTSSFSQMYVQANVGASSVAADCGTASFCKKRSTGSKFIFGYELTEKWSVEGIAINYGKAAMGTTTPSDETIKVTGIGAGVAWTNAINDKWNFKTTLSVIKNRTVDNIPATVFSSSTPALRPDFGLGFGYKVTDHATFVIENNMSRGKRIDLNSNIISTSTNLTSLGLRYKF